MKKIVILLIAIIGLICCAFILIDLTGLDISFLFPSAHASGPESDSGSVPVLESGPSSNDSEHEAAETITSRVKEIIYDVKKEDLSLEDKSLKIIDECKDLFAHRYPNPAERLQEWEWYKETLKDRLETSCLPFESDWFDSGDEIPSSPESTEDGFVQPEPLQEAPAPQDSSEQQESFNKDDLIDESTQDEIAESSSTLNKKRKLSESSDSGSELDRPAKKTKSD